MKELKGKLPKNYVIPNNKLTNYIFEKELSDGNTKIEINPRNNRDIWVKINLKNIEINNLTTFDRLVYNAICSLYEAENKIITVSQIYRCINGLTDKQFVSEKKREEIYISVDKLKKIYISINFEEEAELYSFDHANSKMEGFLVEVEKKEVLAGGKKVIAYEIYDKPILYKYSQIFKQVISLDLKLLNTKKSFRSTRESMIIREYLIMRIAVMKRNKQQNKIKLSTISTYACINNDTDKAQFKVRKISKDILQSLVDEKYIKNYRLYKYGNKYIGIEILY